MLFGSVSWNRELEPTGIRDQLALRRPGRDYGDGFIEQHWLAFKRIAERLSPKRRAPGSDSTPPPSERFFPRRRAFPGVRLSWFILFAGLRPAKLFLLALAIRTGSAHALSVYPVFFPSSDRPLHE